MSDVVKIKLKGKKIKAISAQEEKAQKGIVEIDDEEAAVKKLQKEYEKGFNDGYQQGANETQAQYEEFIIQKNEEFYSILKEFESKIEEYENSFSEIVIKIAGRIAQKILKREIETESIVKETIGDALSQVIAAQNIVIKINPDDLTLIETEGDLTHDSRFNKIRFEPDKSIEKGGCIIETEIGNVDARINSQLEEILKQLELKFVNKKEDDVS
jgi:flagellar assembly protein FliH